ncbi:unnamed protein product [Rotaria sp. Silwood1]|nr:unnamed protein product [Rotaria sp. Silwood1]
MDDESDDSIITMSMIEKEQETMSLTITTETATTPVSRKEKKKKGIFKKDWLNIKEYSPWLQEIKNDPTKARCKTCLRTFSVHYDGKTALKKHMNSDLHKSCIKSFTNTSSIVLPAPCVSEIQKISSIEGTFVYHGVKHGHSYTSQQCTINLVKTLFESSSTVAKSLSCAKTKSRAIACNVLAPYFTRKILDEVLEARFYSISFDASNKGNTKIYPFVIQYFSDIGVKKGLIDFIEDSRETALDIFNNIIKVLLQHINIRWLSLLRSIERLIETYEPLRLYFLNHQTTIKKFTTAAENMQILISFFNNSDGLCTLNFLEIVLDDIQQAEFKLQRTWTTAVDLYRIITNLIKKLEQRLHNKYFGNEVHLIFNRLKEVDKNRVEELQESFELFIKTVVEYINSYFNPEKEFYEILSVLDSQSIHFLEWDYFMNLVNLIKIDGINIDELYNEYCEIKFIYDHMKNKNVTINEQIKSNISSKNVYNSESATNNNYEILCDIIDNEKDDILNKDQDSKGYIQSDQLWSYLLNIKPNTTPNLKLIISYVFSIPRSNAFVESIFSHMNHLWSDYRNRMDMELVAAELQIRKNANISCKDFYKFILSQEDLLKKIASNEKFGKKKRILDK